MSQTTTITSDGSWSPPVSQTVTIRIYGAGGGDGGDDLYDNYNPRDGGNGGYVRTELYVRSWQSLEFELGESGEDGSVSGGGDGGSGYYDGVGGLEGFTNAGGGGGGGGSTAVFYTGDLVAVADAGGGGAGALSENGGAGSGGPGARGGSGPQTVSDAPGDGYGGDGGRGSTTQPGGDGGGEVFQGSNTNTSTGSGNSGDATIVIEYEIPPQYTPTIQSISSDDLDHGETFTVDYDVENTGGDLNNSGQEVELVVDGNSVDSDSLSLSPGDSTTGTLTWDTNDGGGGSHTIQLSTADDTSGTRSVMVEFPRPDVVELLGVGLSDGTTVELPLVDPQDEALEQGGVKLSVNGQELAPDLVNVGDEEESAIRVKLSDGVYSWREKQE